jgi:hypothetical protein
MELIDVIDKRLGNGQGRVRMLEWYEVSILGELVNDYQDDIMAAGLGKAFDEVKADCMPGFWGNWQWLEESRKFGVLHFRPLADITALNKILN